MTRVYAVALPLLSLWLLAWIVFSWGAAQDDSLIHLRYAENLLAHHVITYDGVHRDYGSSSLLYVSLLALLAEFTSSVNLPRAVSSVVHGLLFVGVAYAVCFALPARAKLAKAVGSALLVLLAMPSAVRWLDDGMETGTVLATVSLIAWVVHRQFAKIGAGDEGTGYAGYIALILIGLFSVLLRTELCLPCLFGTLILVLGRGVAGLKTSGWRGILRRSHLAVGAGAAIVTILATMHVLLPDTAIAKSHGLGHWLNPIHDTAVTLGGAMSFGAGLAAFWLLTLLLVWLEDGPPTPSTALANAFFPVVLVLASLRGQEIQGVRYLGWTFFFPIVWNTLELARGADSTPAERWSTRWSTGRSVALAGAFLAVLLLDLPFEASVLYRVLTHRGDTMREFQQQHLEVLRDRQGVSADIGYIGYFSQARICDLSGLVNGRAAARLTNAERNVACGATHPDFVFGNSSQLAALSSQTDLSGWQICGRYEFLNVRSADTHYLLVRPELAQEVCHATSSVVGRLAPVHW